MQSNPRACRDCGSPAEGNPCWYYLRRKYYGGDPPCLCRAYDREQAALTRRRVWQAILAFGLIVGFVKAAIFVMRIWIDQQ